MNLGEQSLDCSLVNPHTGAFQSSHIVSSLPLIFTSLLHPASPCLLPLPPQCLFAAPLDQSPSTLCCCRVSLPIKVVSSQQNLDKPQQLFNVDRTENKAGMLKHYTDIEVQTGTSRNQLRFFLSDLGEHKAILGYSWFAAVQPKINWKQGWIDSTQLPIILRAPNAKKARFLPHTINAPCPIHHSQYFIGRVTINSALKEEDPKIPTEYMQHRKVFSKYESHRLPQHTIWDHTIELLPGAPTTLPG